MTGGTVPYHRAMAHEAPLIDNGHGLVAADDGWFVVNALEAQWQRSEAFGTFCRFEGEARFPQLGINIHVLEPGKPTCMYHGEDTQEGFLVLAGECILLVEGVERRLRRWDYFHCPAWTEHVLVGGDEPCTVLSVGARPDLAVLYPVAPVALRHGAGVTTETRFPEEAYAPFSDWVPMAPPTRIA